MSQTILIENDDSKDLLSALLTSSLETEIIHLKSAEDAISLLKILPNLPLVITRNRMGTEETSSILSLFLNSEKHDASIIVLGPHPVIWSDVIKAASEKLALKTESIGFRFVPLKFQYLKNLSEPPCDVFIRIRKKADEYQFVKLLNRNEKIDATRLKKYEEQNVELFVTSDNLSYFLTSMANRIVSRLEDDELSLYEKLLTSSSAHDTVRSLIRELELSQVSIDISEASIKWMKESIEDSLHLPSTMTKLLSDEVSFAYQFCYLRALLCHHILTYQTWYKKEHLDVLSFASFFSDITLETPEEMLISGLGEIDPTLSEIKKNQILNHARDAALKVKAHPFYTPQIDTVMLQMNGTAEGIGFETNPSEGINPLAKIFIVADAFVRTLLDPKLPTKKKEILSLLKGKYKNPSYQKIIKTLEQKLHA